MIRETNSKIEARHLKGNAYLYVRQSTLRQVFENQESTKRQYALRQRAVVLGWPLERIIVVDSDLGQSAASSSDREGFQRLWIRRSKRDPPGYAKKDPPGCSVLITVSDS